MKIADRLRQFLRGRAAELTPSAVAWRGAAVALWVVLAAVILAFFYSAFLHTFAWQKLPAFPVAVGFLLGIGLLLLGAVAVLSRMPLTYRRALLLAVPITFFLFAPGDAKQQAIFTALVLLIASLIGAGIAVLRRDGFHPRRQKVTVAGLSLGMLGLLGGAYAIFSDKGPANPWLAGQQSQDLTLDLANPGLPGPHEVLETSYGSGRDLRRDEFGKNVGIRSRSVDGRKLIENWEGFSGWLRTSYWGFDASELPLQARVWYPAGAGPFPLVLIVHGNHEMEDFSDPGYAYLGELFASRGMILASVDENFLNFAMSASVDVLAERPGLKEENDARGWLLLQHLAQWRDWNQEPGHPFQGKVDMGRIGLIGHSRGGEAVAVAAAFNSLARYPDDATLEFDFGFDLRGVIAIAPVDGQYRPRDNPTPIRDINYFTIHGSMDGDVQSFDGTAQYSRVQFSGDPFRFRSSLYIDGANHGQFNTTWGNLDTFLLDAWALDLDRIMDGEAQRDVARVFFAAFMEVVLNDRREYLPIFADARKAAKWLPEVFYISQYSSSDETTLASFEEDIDPETMTLPGGSIRTQNLSKWYEVRNALKSARRVSAHATHAAVYAWDSKFSKETASVTFQMPAGWVGAEGSSIISASISAAGVNTMPSDWDPGESDDDGQLKEDTSNGPKTLDWTVRLTDANGVAASLPLSQYAPLYPLLKAITRRAAFLDGAEATEVLFRRYEFKLADFAAASPNFDAKTLVTIEFIFDRSEKGAIIIDDLSM